MIGYEADERKFFMEVTFRRGEPVDTRELRRIHQDRDLEAEVLYSSEYEVVVSIRPTTRG